MLLIGKEMIVFVCWSTWLLLPLIKFDKLYSNEAPQNCQEISTRWASVTEFSYWEIKQNRAKKQRTILFSRYSPHCYRDLSASMFVIDRFFPVFSYNDERTEFGKIFTTRGEQQKFFFSWSRCSPFQFSISNWNGLAILG